MNEFTKSILKAIIGVVLIVLPPAVLVAYSLIAAVGALPENSPPSEPAAQTSAPVGEVAGVAAEDEEEHDEALSPEAAAGLEIFQTAGCAACHGQNGEGNIGPALAGHTEEQIFRQVRTPKGNIMPPFAADQLSDDDVEKIVAWIATLGDEIAMEHQEEATTPELSMTEASHLRLITDSLAAENQADAVHHARHLVEDASPEIKPLAQMLLADLQAGQVHEAEAQAGDALGPLADKAFDPVAVHLGMALSAAQRDDLPDVDHHLESAVVAAANHDHQPEMQRLLDDWRRCDDPHDVIDRLYEALALDHQD